MSAPIELPVSEVVQALEERLPALIGHDVRAPLIRARLADALRDEDVPPPTPRELEPLYAALDPEGWRRLALLVGLLDVEPIREECGVAVASELDVLAWVKAAFVGLAAELRLHTLELLARSPHRREELARLWLLRQGIAVAGESSEESMAALDRLDYARLLNEAERARESAKERTEYLRKLQEKADRMLAPRGKW